MSTLKRIPIPQQIHNNFTTICKGGVEKVPPEATDENVPETDLPIPPDYQHSVEYENHLANGHENVNETLGLLFTEHFIGQLFRGKLTGQVVELPCILNKGMIKKQARFLLSKRNTVKVVINDHMKDLCNKYMKGDFVEN